MNRRLLLLLAIVAFAAPGMMLRAQQQPAQQPQGPPGILRGIVVREGTAEPIRDVRITAGQGNALANAVLIESALAAGLAGATIESLLNSLSVQATGGAAASGGASQTYSAVTDSDGRFTIEGIPPGQQTVTGQREGFFGTAANNAIAAPAMARGIATITSQQTTEITLTMVPGAAVSGRVLGPTGMPVSNIAVEVLRSAYNNGVRTLQIVNQKPSDDRGEYRLFQLPPGEYYLAATPRLIAGLRGAAANSPGQPIEVRTYYPNAIDGRNALPITLKPGDDLTGMNLQLQTLLGAKVSGRVVSLLPATATVPQAGNAGVIANRGNNASITLLPRDRNAFVDPRQNLGITVSLVSPNDGAFEIPNVPAGSYDVYASVPVAFGWGPAAPPGLATTPVAYGRASIDVRGSDVSGVAISVHQGVDVTGQILVDGKPALAPVRMGLLPIDSSAGLPVFNQVGRGTIPIQQDGSFLIPLVPEATYRPQPTILAGAAITQLITQLSRGGRGAIAATATPPPTPPPLPANAYVADVRQGGTSVYDDGLSIGTSIVGPLEVQINTNGGSIQGSVVGAGQQPHTSGAVVVLMPPVNRRQNPVLYRTASPNPQGTFTIDAVPPGPYRLFAWESLPLNAYLNADFMKTYEDRGVSIVAQANTTISPTVPVILVDRR